MIFIKKDYKLGMLKRGEATLVTLERVISSQEKKMIK